MKLNEEKLKGVLGDMSAEMRHSLVDDTLSEVEVDHLRLMLIRLALEADECDSLKERSFCTQALKRFRKKYEPLWRLIDG